MHTHIEKQLKIKQLWTVEKPDGTTSIFVLLLLPDDSLIEFINTKVIETKDSIEVQTDISKHSNDGGVTFNMEISRPKITTKKQKKEKK